MSSLLMIFYSGTYWYTKIPLSLIGLTTIFLPHLRRVPQTWFMGACFILFEIIFNWHESDNHKYLTCYWFMSLWFITLRSNSDAEDEERLMELHGRLYLILCMIFAVIWKNKIKRFYKRSLF